MTPEHFLELAQIFPEPLLLISGDGEIIASNRPLAAMLGLASKELKKKKLFDIVIEPTEKVINYLEACSRSRQMVLGGLTLRKHDGQTLTCRSEGAVIRPWSPESPALTLLRLKERTSASSNFILLNKQIKELKKEVQQRQQAQEDLYRTNETLQQTLQTLQTLQINQLQLVQTEKMSSLRQLVAGIAHEINNPINFIHANLFHTSEYAQDLMQLVQLYQQHYPNPIREIQSEVEAIDLDFIKEDLNKLLKSMKMGTDRIQDIVNSLRNFSRLGEAEVKKVNIHEGIDSTLMILHHRLQEQPQQSGIEVIKEYSQLPLLDCHAGELNQVFMNILSNALDALDEYNKQRTSEEIKTNPSTIWIRTEVLDGDWIALRIADNGPGIAQKVCQQIFDPFFTTKPVGKGKGLGLSICYQIVTQKHGGRLRCISEPGQGTEFIIEIPTCQSGKRKKEGIEPR